MYVRIQYETFCKNKIQPIYFERISIFFVIDIKDCNIKDIHSECKCTNAEWSIAVRNEWKDSANESQQIGWK